MKYTVRPMLVEDLDTANRLCIAAYATPKAPLGDYKQELEQYLRMQPDGWYFVCNDSENGEAVGVGGTVNYGTFAYIGMIAVDPPMQRRGVGKAIMQQLLDWLRSQGCQCVVLDATEAGAGLYQQLGFRDVGLTAVFRPGDIQEQSKIASAKSSATAISVLTRTELPGLVRFDAHYFGAERHTVLETYFADYPKRLLVARGEQGHIIGYVLAQDSSLGPWVASSVGVAEDLLRAALRMPFENALRLRIPAENEDAVVLVKRAGFQQVRSLRHMQFGEVDLDRSEIYALASLAIG